MTYLRILAMLDTLLRRAERTGWWTFTDWRGHIAFRQIDYAKRVQKASGWEPVEVCTHPLVTYSYAPSARSVITPTASTTAGTVHINWGNGTGYVAPPAA